MSTISPNPAHARLQESIGELVTKAVAEARAHDLARITELETALSSVRAQLVVGQQAITEAERIISSLDGKQVHAAPTNEPLPPSPTPQPANNPGTAASMEIDVVAHGASIAQASGLQTFLRSLEGVQDVATREFVNGELRLLVQAPTNPNNDDLKQWLADNSGEVLSVTESVLEIEFSS